jgi:predicted DNA-binding transcriptional regulator AlpA
MNTSQTSERGSVADTQLQTLLNEHDVARITGLSVASVRRWRLLGRGPRYMKIGASVRYHPEALQAFLSTRPTGGESSTPEVR